MQRAVGYAYVASAVDVGALLYEARDRSRLVVARHEVERRPSLRARGSRRLDNTDGLE
jgi:hypothetical protein